MCSASSRSMAARLTVDGRNKGITSPARVVISNAASPSTVVKRWLPMAPPGNQQHVLSLEHDDAVGCIVDSAWAQPGHQSHEQGQHGGEYRHDPRHRRQVLPPPGRILAPAGHDEHHSERAEQPEERRAYRFAQRIESRLVPERDAPGFTPFHAMPNILSAKGASGPSASMLMRAGRRQQAGVAAGARAVRTGQPTRTRSGNGGQQKSRPKGRLLHVAVWWAVQGSNLRPLPCEGNALPLS